ncbi:MAG: transposase [Lachnospiraceae bacterium]|nr:transposase [Lachnospiraceae bacterium]
MGKRLKPDAVLKEYWKNNERFADFFNAVLFGGREVIYASQLQERDTEESNVLELGAQDESITAARDLFRVLKTAMGVEFALVGMENQDKIHYGMPVRVLNLDAYAYDKQWKGLKEKYKNAQGMTEDEYLSHMKKEDKFLPVVTVVIYYGEKAWDGARDLHGVLNIPDEIKPFVGNYPMHLVEVVNNTLQFKNADNRDLFQLLNLVYNASLDKKERLKRAQEYEDSHTVDEDVVRALAATNNIKIDKTKRKERLKVCTLFEEIAKDSREEANIETAREMIKDNEPIERIMKYSRLSKETILELQKQENLQSV